MRPSTKTVDEASGRYLPIIYAEELPFWEGAKKRTLQLQRCNQCEKPWYPIGPTCPHCFSTDFRWDVMSGKGVVHAKVVYHKAWTKWFEDKVPYAVVQVQLAEGPRLTTNVLECDVREVRIGMPVEVTYQDITEEITLVQFRPAPGALSK